MTHNAYTQQQLRCKSLARLKQIYSEIGCTLEVNDRRCKDSWRSAITRYQARKLQKVDEQDIAQGEFDQYIADQANAIASEELAVREISFYHHEYYAGDRLIVAIDYDNDLTQPWVVTINNAEVFRAATPMMCDRYIRIHYKDGSLPVQEQETPTSTGNEIMFQIATECDKYTLELLDDGIYTSDGEKLGEVGCTDGLWWFARVNQKRTFCDSAADAVWLLQISNELPTANEYLQYHPLEQLSSGELRWLFETPELVAV
ncbi:hypothetical protein [Nostoc sp. FACHB-145]|uniref:hypothetical protein n=1 Tax=Nostoc sp. FACHB-145 TaxID=2692836 RepID=UPI0016843843|nr:hypothetical protein [Nostoc sp. FACHB-145]MBD2468764.1 hypothetical protein [Nostoc sp. FACHB-145]